MVHAVAGQRHPRAAPAGQGKGRVDPLIMFRAVVAASREAVAIISPDGRVLYANSAHDALFGRSACAWRGDYGEMWTPASRTTLEAEMAADGGEGALEAQDASGRRFPVWHRARVERGADGGALFFVLYLHDQSAQLAAEAADKAKTRFLAAASHDLRQPLQALSMFVSVLSGRDHTPANRKVIDRIEDSLAATDALLSSLLDISKLDAGMVIPAVETVSVMRILTRLSEEFAPLAQKTGVALRVVPCGASVRTDGALLERILRNLLTNALRYTEQGGVLLGCRRHGNTLRIQVWDTGAGIPPDQLDAIFREFHRLGHASRDGHQGLGLGLAIVQRLARLLGHPVTVRSTPHQGSVFAVEVPLAG